MATTAEQITRNHKRRHSRSDYYNKRCKNCGNFVSKPEPEHGKITYVCPNCGRAILEYVKQASATD